MTHDNIGSGYEASKLYDCMITTFESFSALSSANQTTSQHANKISQLVICHQAREPAHHSTSCPAAISHRTKLYPPSSSVTHSMFHIFYCGRSEVVSLLCSLFSLVTWLSGKPLDSSVTGEAGGRDCLLS